MEPTGWAGGPQRRLLYSPLKARLAGRTEYAAVLVIIAGLALRLAEASRTYLNPDEALQLYLSLPRDWYRNFVKVAHPPLLFFVLHAVQRVSSSELALRAMPVLSGSIFPWVAYRWLTKVRNTGAGFVALLILTFSPNLVSLSAQVRGYVLALLFAALALLLIELAFEAESALRLVLFTACLYLAILSEYSVAWFAGAAGIYVLVRGVESRVSRRFWLVWGLGQAGALLIYAFLYRTAITSPLARGVLHGEVPLYSQGAFPGAHENLLAFACLGTMKQFAYTLSSIPLGVVAAVLFALGLVVLWRDATSGGRLPGRALAIAMPAGFLLGLAAAILKVLPYGRSRHTVIFCLFIVAGVGVGVEALLGKKPWVCVLAAVALVTSWPLIAEPDQNNISEIRHGRVSMLTALSRLHSLLPPDALVLTDMETALLLRYYWCGEQEIQSRTLVNSATEWRLDGFRTVFGRWDLGGIDRFTGDVATVRRAFGLRPDEALWVVDGGFDVAIAAQLRARYHGQTPPDYHDLNGVFVVFRTPPGI